jgi:hypothetical protein
VRITPFFLAGALLTLAGAPARAHDTWFQPLPGPGAPQLALGTGNQFPVQEVPVGASSLVESGCRGSDGRAAPLRVLRESTTALRLQAPGGGDGLSCWGQQASFEVELPADKVALYLREINPPAWVRDEWARLQAAGLPWKERYAKHARIDLRGASGPAQPVPMAMDVVLDERALRVGQTLSFQVLRDGRPLPDQAVELRGDMSPLGFWLRTDVEGRARIALPLPGRWVLRGTDLRRSEGVPDQFESRFFNLAFEVQPRDSVVRPAAP